VLKCFTWNNVEIDSNAEIHSNAATHRCIKPYKIGTMDQGGPPPYSRKMPLLALMLAA